MTMIIGKNGKMKTMMKLTMRKITMKMTTKWINEIEEEEDSVKLFMNGLTHGGKMMTMMINMMNMIMKRRKRMNNGLVVMKITNTTRERRSITVTNIRRKKRKRDPNTRTTMERNITEVGHLWIQT